MCCYTLLFLLVKAKTMSIILKRKSSYKLVGQTFVFISFSELEIKLINHYLQARTSICPTGISTSVDSQWSASATWIMGGCYGRCWARHHAWSNPLAQPKIPRLLPNSQLLPCDRCWHAVWSHCLHWILMGKFFLTLFSRFIIFLMCKVRVFAVLFLLPFIRCSTSL